MLLTNAEMNGRSCGKVPVRLKMGTWVATAPESKQFCLVFVDLFAGGGLTAAAVTLDTVADESRKMADGVAKSPSRLCSRGGKICCYGDASSTIFLLASVPCFLLFVFLFFLFLFFPASRCVYLLRVPSSVQQPSANLKASTYFTVRVLSAWLGHLYPTPSRNPFVFLVV